MKKSHIFLFFLFISVVTRAQNIVIGPDNSIKNSEILTQIIGEKNGVIYIQKTQSDIFRSDGEYLERFDAHTLKSLGNVPLLLNTAYLESKQKKLNPYFEQAFIFKNQIIMFLTAHERNEKKLKAYVGTFDEEDRSQGIFEVDQIVKSNSYDPGKFVFFTNKNEKKIAIWQQIPGAKKDLALFGISVLNEDLKQEWKKGFALPYQRDDVEIINIESDTLGNMAILTKIFLPKKEIKNGKDPYRYHLITFSVKNYEVKDHIISIPNKRITDAQVLINNEQEIIVTGFVGNEWNNGVSGSWYGSYDFNGNSIQPLVYASFSQEIMEHFLKEKNILRGDGIPGFSIDRVFLRANGGLYTVSEQYLIQEVCNRDARGIQACNYYYYYNSIVVNAVKEDGSFEWSRMIPKYQNSVNDNGWFSSYAVMHKNDTLYFLYNEHAKNFDVNDPDKYKSMLRPGKATLALTKVFPDGRVRKEALLQSKTGNSIIRPRFYNYDAQGNLILPAYSQQNNSFKIIKIGF